MVCINTTVIDTRPSRCSGTLRFLHAVKYRTVRSPLHSIKPSEWHALDGRDEGCVEEPLRSGASKYAHRCWV
eukprot:834280-Amphidinium_carterae.1